MVPITGTDETFAAEVHARTSCRSAEVAWGATFRNIFNPPDGNGMLSVDVDRPDEFGVVPLPGPGGVIHPRGRARRPARAQPWCVVRACACFGRSPALICRAYSVFRFASETTSRIVWRHFRLPHLQP